MESVICDTKAVAKQLFYYKHLSVLLEIASGIIYSDVNMAAVVKTKTKTKTSTANIKTDSAGLLSFNAHSEYDEQSNIQLG